MKKSRKRLLISSVAMLLVAMLALGTATFAWFTNNTTVQATGMQMTASVAKGLQITGKNGDATDAVSSSNWGSKVNFVSDEVLNNISVNYTNGAILPASTYWPKTVKTSTKLVIDAEQTDNDTSDQFTQWQTVTGYPVPASEKGTLAKSSGNDFYQVYEVGVRATDDTIKTKEISMVVKVTGEAANYSRVAVLSGKTDSTDAYSGTNGNKVVKVVGDGASTYAVSAATPTVSTTAQSVAASNTVIDTFTGVDLTNIKWYTIVCWFEGQDDDCVDSNAGKAINVEVNFSYTPD